MQVTVTAADGSRNIDAEFIVFAQASNGGSLLTVDQDNGSSFQLQVDETPANIALQSGNLLFQTTFVRVPLVVGASFNYNNATASFVSTERIISGQNYGDLVSLTGSAMSVIDFTGKGLSDNDYIKGQVSGAVAQVDGAVTYNYPEGQLVYINVGRCQQLKPSVAGLSTLDYVYANPKIASYYTTLTQAQLTAAAAAVIVGASIYQVKFTADGSQTTFTDADIDFSVPSGLTSITGGDLLLLFTSNSMDNDLLVDPVLPAVIGAGGIELSGAPSNGTIVTAIISI